MTIFHISNVGIQGIVRSTATLSQDVGSIPIIMQLTFVIVLMAFLSTQVFAKHKEARIQTYNCGVRLRVKPSQIDTAVKRMERVYKKSSPSCNKKPNLLNKCYKIGVEYLKYRGTYFPPPENDEILLKKAIRFNIFHKKPLNRYFVVARCSNGQFCSFLGIIRWPRFTMNEIKCIRIEKKLPTTILHTGLPQPVAPPGFTSPNSRH